MILLLKGNKEILEQESNSRTCSIVPMDFPSLLEFAASSLVLSFQYLHDQKKSSSLYKTHTHTHIHTRRHQKQPTVQFVSPPGSLVSNTWQMSMPSAGVECSHVRNWTVSLVLPTAKSPAATCYGAK